MSDGSVAPRQILFGDLRVHTTYSVDASFSALPLNGGVGTHPLADACDFTRRCVLDLRDTAVETPEQVASRIRAALAHVPAERLVIAPDCGLKYLPRDVSFAKLRSMVQGRDIIRTELA